MTLAIILVIAAALSLISILSITVSRALQLSDAGTAGPLQPVDIEAFRNLVDPVEDEYLRLRLLAADLRTVRRARLRAMAAYVVVAARNAAILIRIGQTALAANDPQTIDAARQLVHQALLLRRNASFALLKIYAAWAWPTSGAAASPILRGYEQMSGSAMLLGRLQNPAVPVRIASAL